MTHLLHWPGLAALIAKRAEALAIEAQQEADDRDDLEQRAVTEIIRSMLREGRATARQATRLLESPDLPAEQRAEIERDLKALAVVLKRCAELAQEGGYE